MTTNTVIGTVGREGGFKSRKHRYLILTVMPYGYYTLTDNLEHESKSQPGELGYLHREEGRQE